MNNVRIVKAEKKNLPRVLEIYTYAREFMRKNGNPTQWENFSAIKDSLVNDMENGNLYIIRDDENIYGAFAFIVGEDSTYKKIEQGEWLSGAEYGTIHRVASDGRIHGMMEMIVQFCSEMIAHLRVDTHADNKIMQHLILKNGFKRCGIIYISDGSPRIAYERI